jgi:DNA-binding transcriptional regulator PaaX
LFDTQNFAVLRDSKYWELQQILGEAEFSHKTLRLRLARLERQGMQEGQRQMCASKLSPKALKGINTIF